MNLASYVISSCPRCAGAVAFDQDATGTRCRYCGAGLMVMGGRSSWLNFLIKPVIPVKDTGREITHIAMKSGWKPTHLRSVVPFFFPFFRSTGQALRWAQGERRDEQTGECVPVTDLTVRAADVMRPAHTDLSCGLFSPGHRAQSLLLHLATRENAGQVPFAPVQVDRDAHAVKARDDFFEQMPEAGFRVLSSHRACLHERHSLIFFPIYLVEVREGKNLRLILLDAVGGGLIRQIGHTEMEKFLDNLGLKARRSPGESRLRLVPLICPECSADLDQDPSAFVRFCRGCGRAWEEGRGRLREFPVHWTGEAPGREDGVRHLPFWKREGRGGRHCMPAFSVRSPRLLFNLSVRYRGADLPAEPVPHRDRAGLRTMPVAFPPDQVEAMADFVDAVAPVPKAASARGPSRLVLVPFRRRGTDYVDVVRGVAVPAGTLGEAQ